jgi:hypothetical protein
MRARGASCTVETQDGAGGELTVHERGDRDGVPGKTVQKVRRAVERVGNEHQATGRARGRRELLGDQRRVRMAAADDFLERAFGSVIDVAHEVRRGFTLPLELGQAGGASADLFRRLGRRGHARREQGAIVG